ncbi:MAG: lytic murein transglycosylase [Candidatus Nealsonbacteria bacterium]|nr:lytic murein transglycosylase [Candidatus Nealsonbacteria bacterium]
MLFAVLLASALILPGLFVFAALSPSEERTQLEEELKKLEEQIAAYDQKLDMSAKEKKTLENRIYTLRNTIKKLDLQIYQSNILIDDLGLQIDDTEESIEQTTLQIEKARDRLALIIRTIDEEDQRPLLGVLLSEGFSEFFDNLASLEALNIDNQKLLEDIKSMKIYLEDEKASLDEEREGMEKQVTVQTLQRQQSASAKSEEERLLRLTEAEYQKFLKQREQTQLQAQQIRSRIFELIGVPEAPTFGEAYEIAKFVGTATGVRPALVLAVLTQESNIGKNVGQCYLKVPSTGAGVVAYNGKQIDRVMNPTRDVPHFLKITASSGRDPYSTPVSCPMSIGWGGAMGPAQFIPSTWALYEQKIAAAAGHTPDPWNIADAFMASGLYLKDLGAQSNEFNAVMKYFSGASWSKWEEFYGRSVLSIATQYESDIAELEK